MVVIVVVVIVVVVIVVVVIVIIVMASIAENSDMIFQFLLPIKKNPHTITII